MARKSRKKVEPEQEPAVDSTPAVDTEPAVDSTPAVDMEPAVDSTPVADVEPVEEEPVVVPHSFRVTDRPPLVPLLVIKRVDSPPKRIYVNDEEAGVDHGVCLSCRKPELAGGDVIVVRNRIGWWHDVCFRKTHPKFYPQEL
jgi:hypothetical protein